MLNNFSKYWGGTNLKGALERVKEYNDQGIAVSLSYLPMTQEDQKGISHDIEEYEKMLDAITSQKLNCDVTIKLNQFGIYGSEKLAQDSIEPIIKKAQELGSFVWVDMEKDATVASTVNIYKNLHKKYTNMGLCLQAYLKRTEQDVLDVTSSPSSIRLVKGFYKADDFKTWDEVTANYNKVMELVLSKAVKPAIATHDLILQQKAKEIIKRENLINAELQMFAGVRDELAVALVKEGYKVRLYLPYGNLFTYFGKGLKTFDNWRNFQRFIGVKHIQ